MPDRSTDDPEDSKPLLSVDFSQGEQFWKYWATKKVKLAGGDTVRLKVLSKRTKHGRYELICVTDLEDGSKIVWAEGYWETDAELVAFVRGVQASIIHTVGREVCLELVDLTGCDTYDKWHYKLSEGTTIRLWTSEDGKSVRANA